MKQKVGLIAMGSRENRPNWQDMISLLEPELEVEMAGVLDSLTEPEIEARFSFAPGENYIVTEMPWGSTVHISEEKAKAEVTRLSSVLFAGGRAPFWCCAPGTLTGRRRRVGSSSCPRI